MGKGFGSSPVSSRKNGLGQPLPTFCLKVPTGGGKTLLAVKTIDLVNTIYRKRQTGLVLWIVPTTQIYRQTIQHLKDRDHPYRQHLDLATGGHTRDCWRKPTAFRRRMCQENLVVLMLMLPSANRKTKETSKVFKDSGGFQDFFPPEDDIKEQEAMLKRFPNLDTYGNEKAGSGAGRSRLLWEHPPDALALIILDEGHKAYSEGAQETLRGFNPCLIAELSATPVQSNILVEITGRELHSRGDDQARLARCEQGKPGLERHTPCRLQQALLFWKRRPRNTRPTPALIFGPSA